MIYKDFNGIKLSALGLGCMRLPVVNGDDTVIDEALAAKMVDMAMERGINYYDTAWGYHGGKSEPVVGKLLKGYPRDSYYIASKFPGYDLDNLGKVEEIFEEQLKRTGMEYFDFYLFHNVCELNIDGYLDDGKYGIYSYLSEQKKRGRIRHLGFSVHGEMDTFKRFLDAYGDDMEFCQIQLNWLDWDFQRAKDKVELLDELGIPVWVMEPLRGGMLVRLSPEDENKLAALRPGESIPAWAFRFLQSVKGVTMVLSGMSDLEQLSENIGTFETEELLSADEMKTLFSIAEGMTDSVPCTACRYCTGHCPQGLDIPDLISLYNEHSFTGGGFIAPMALMAVPEDKHPSACLGCRSCEAVCPQGIKISEVLSDFVKKLG